MQSASRRPSSGSEGCSPSYTQSRLLNINNRREYSRSSLPHFTYNHLLDVLLGFFEILSDFLEVLLHEVLVGEKFLVFHQRSNFILGDVFALLKDGHGVVVVLVVEDHVEAGLLEVLEVEAEAAVGEHGHEVGGHQTHNLWVNKAD